MTGIVPYEILERKRKAFLEVRPQRSISASPFYEACAVLTELSCVDQARYRQAAQRAANGVSEARLGLRPAVALEAWLESQLPSRMIRRVGRCVARMASTSSAEVLGKF